MGGCWATNRGLARPCRLVPWLSLSPLVSFLAVLSCPDGSPLLLPLNWVVRVCAVHDRYQLVAICVSPGVYLGFVFYAAMLLCLFVLPAAGPTC